MVNCSGPSNFTIAAMPAMMGIIQSWVSVFAGSCPQTMVQIESVASSSISSQRLCEEEIPVGIASMSRDFLSTEARPPGIPLSGSIPRGHRYLRFCSSSYPLIQTEVGIEALVMIAPAGLPSDSAACIELLGGGLSIPQLRWMFSSFTDEELSSSSNGSWNATEVIPNSDGNSSTHLWSELNANCVKEEIILSGLMADSRELDLFSRLVLNDMENGEMIDMTRSAIQLQTSNEAVTSFVNATGSSIGFVGFWHLHDHPVENNAIPILAVDEEEEEGPNRLPLLRPWPPFEAVMVLPSLQVLQNGTTYALSRRLYMNVGAQSRMAAFMTVVFSDVGQAMLSSHGLVPLSLDDRFIMLSRLGAEGGIPDAINDVMCAGQGGRSLRTYAVSPGLVQLTTLFVKVFRDTCLSRTTIIEDTTAGAADLVCRDDAADLAMMPRKFTADEAMQLRNGFAFRCVREDSGGFRRTIHEFVVALDAIVFGTATEGAARDCVGLLGGLSVGQLRWMYSSRTYTELVAMGWDPMSVPNSDGDDSTRLWSELDSRCVRQEVERSAYLVNDAELLDFFSSEVLIGEGETVDQSRVTMMNGPTISVGANGLVLLSYSALQRDRLDLSVVGVQDDSMSYVAPNARTIQDRSYGSLVQPVYMNALVGGLGYLTLGRFLNTILSPTGEMMVRYKGYVPLSDEDLTEMLRRHDAVVRSLFCFSSSTEVDVRGKGRTPISDIKIGDFVLSVNDSYERVYSFGHYGESIAGDFVQVHVEEGVAVELTGNHLIVVNGVVTCASSIKSGDLLTKADGGSAKVARVATVKRKGVYAPFTESGMIVVNGYVASSYAHIGGGKSSANWIDATTYQFLAHLAEAPHRLVCATVLKLCQSEVYNRSGMSWWASHQLATFDWLDDQPPAIAVLLVLPLLVVLVLFTLAEVLTKYYYCCGIMVAFLVVVTRRERSVKGKID